MDFPAVAVGGSRARKGAKGGSAGRNPGGPKGVSSKPGFGETGNGLELLGDDVDLYAAEAANEATKGSSGKKGKSGGFQSLGLSKSIFAGIMRLGYKMPTPIQRKTLPVTLSGRDVVAMARTGSGKTAAFLIPTLEKLGSHSSTVGARALILSPTRELAQQTHKFAVSMGKFTTLRICLLQGGDKLEDQFQALANNPDIIVSTPGRLVHLLVEIPDFGLQRIEVFVVDEADRLFEMGFALQLKEILDQLPEQRQTLLFSATMPAQLLEFTRAGLDDPELIRLDTETKLSENLKLAFFAVRTKEKMAGLVHLLTEVIPKDDLTIVFTATRHHVDFVKECLETMCSVTCSIAYGSMDMAARKLNIDRFRQGYNKVLVVTDVAARGLDIPLLNNVVNFEFPCKPKLFVHRVGRAARAGRHGTAYSFVTQDEIPFVVDLHLYLGRKMRGFEEEQTIQYKLNEMSTDDVDIGRFPQVILDREMERCDSQFEQSRELSKLADIVANAHSLYARTRQEPSRRSVKRAKELGVTPNIHPLFVGALGEDAKGFDLQLKALRNFRPSLTVFEVDALKKGKSNEGEAVVAMKKKRVHHSEAISKEKERKEAIQEEKLLETKREDDKAVQEELEEGQIALKAHQSRVKAMEASEATQAEEPETKRRLSKAERKRLKKGGSAAASSISAVPINHEYDVQLDMEPKEKSFKDPKYFIGAEPSGGHDATESFLSIHTSNEKEPSRASRLEDALLDLTPDDNDDIVTKQRTYHWDKRKKRYIKATLEEHLKSKRVRNESGAIIKVKNRGELYEKWQKNSRSRVGTQGARENSDSEDDAPPAGNPRKRRFNEEKNLTNVKYLREKRKSYVMDNADAKDEIKDEKTIRKEVKDKAKRKEKNARIPHALRKGRDDPYKKKKEEEKRDMFKGKGKAEPSTNRFARSRIVVKGKGGGRGGRNSRGGGRGGRGGRSGGRR